jgi:hypothetical protein
MEEQTDTTTQIDTTLENEPQLTLADIALMASVIAVVSRRGGFEAGELKAIGELYEKILAFLPKQETANAETGNTSDEQPENQLNFDFAQGETVTQ